MGDMATRRLGRTGHRSSLAVLGGAAYWGTTPEVTAQSFATALAAGVNHLDVAPQYGNAERALGPLLPEVRDRLFVACKTLRHDPGGVRAQLEESLTILGCERFDLYQLHAVTDIAELDSRAGAVDAIFRARDEGLCRWVGITGHELTAPRAHREALRRYDIDTVMFPVSPRLWADGVYRHDAEDLLEVAAGRDVGVMAIKAVSARPWGDRSPTKSTWYEPYADAAGVGRGVRFALSVPGVHAFCTPSDPVVAALAIEAAGEFVPMDDDEHADAMRQTAAEEHIFPMPRG